MLKIREILNSEISTVAAIRAENWGTEEYWNYRISGYLNLKLHPQKALVKRVFYVALLKNKIVGLIAGHLTKRYDCEGELQWINVRSKYRNKGIASSLLKTIAVWFTKQNAKLVCIDVDSENMEGISFYKKHKALQLNDHWMVWSDISKLV